MFLDNKYTRIYYRIIENAIEKKRVKRRTTHKHYVYYEEHHVMPRSMGGSDDGTNLVLLTAREHFICHYLLCKMVKDGSYHWHKVVRAFTFMYSASSHQQRYVNSHLYESARKNIGKIMSISQSGENNSQYGTIWVSHFTLRHCCKIRADHLEEYIQKGYVEKRIVSWGAFDRREQKQKEQEKESIVRREQKQKEQEKESIVRKIRTIDLKIQSLIKQKQLLEAEFGSM